MHALRDPQVPQTNCPSSSLAGGGGTWVLASPVAAAVAREGQPQQIWSTSPYVAPASYLVVTKFSVTFGLAVQYTAQTFTYAIKAKHTQAIATLLRVASSRIQLTLLSPSSQRREAGGTLSVTAYHDSEEAAKAAVALVTQASVNEALSAQALPAASLSTAPVAFSNGLALPTGASAASSPNKTAPVTAAAASSFVIMAGTLFCLAQLLVGVSAAAAALAQSESTGFGA